MTAQMTTQSPADAVFTISSEEELDAAILELGQLDDDVKRDLLARARAVRRVDARYQGRLLPKLHRQQVLFDAIYSFANAHRISLLPRRAKTAARTTGAFSWRAGARVVTDRPDDVIVEWILNTGSAKVKRLFLRRPVPSYELNRQAMLQPENRGLARDIPGVDIDTSEDFTVKPNGTQDGFSSAAPIWPSLEELRQREYTEGDRESLVVFFREALAVLEPAETPAE